MAAATMRGMATFPDSRRDLLDAPIATLATIGKDDLPQLTEIWFLHDEGKLRTSLTTTPSRPCSEPSTTRMSQTTTGPARAGSW